MYEYKIIRTDLGWIIYRKKEIGKLMIMQYLSSSGSWISNKGLAKIFYHKESALSALTIMKHRDEGEKSD